MDGVMQVERGFRMRGLMALWGRGAAVAAALLAGVAVAAEAEIGRASCRERV